MGFLAYPKQLRSMLALSRYCSCRLPSFFLTCVLSHGCMQLYNNTTMHYLCYLMSQIRDRLICLKTGYYYAMHQHVIIYHLTTASVQTLLLFRSIIIKCRRNHEGQSESRRKANRLFASFLALCFTVVRLWSSSICFSTSTICSSLQAFSSSSSLSP